MICNKKEIGKKPTLEQLTIRIWQKKLNVSSIRMYDYYERRNWKKKNGDPLKDLDSAIGIFNTIDVFKRKSGELQEEKHLLQNTDEWKNFTKRIHRIYQNRCNKCGCKDHLEVHHKFYYYAKGKVEIPARLPWEYDMDEVESLCRRCHDKEQKVKCFSEHEKFSGFESKSDR